MIRKYLDSRYTAGIDKNSWRELAKEMLTTLLVPLERRKAKTIETSGNALRIQLGCGDTYLNNWTNIDLARPGRKLDLRWDLKRGLPFKNNSAVAIFSEHFFEHLDLRSSFLMMIECRRVLDTGGVLRIGVPDFGRYIAAYQGQDAIIDEKRSESPTKAIAINEIVYFHGHHSMYDAETLVTMLLEAGFRSAKQMSFGESELSLCPDSVNRKIETLYVEART